MENSKETQLTSGAETPKNFATQKDEKDGATKSGRCSPLLSSPLLSSLLLSVQRRDLRAAAAAARNKDSKRREKMIPSSKIMNSRLSPSRMRKLFFMGTSHPRREWIPVLNFATVIICCIGGLSPTGGVCVCVRAWLFLGEIAPPNGILAIMQQKRECFAPHPPHPTPPFFFFSSFFCPHPIINYAHFAYNTHKYLKKTSFVRPKIK